MGFRNTLQEIEKNATHYVALGQTEIYLDEDDPDLPWSDVTDINEGGGVRLSGPTGFYCIAERHGLKLKWSVDFEDRSANGKGYSLFDRGRLRQVMEKLPSQARDKLAGYLENKVLPPLQENTREWREMLNRQADSEDCVRGLIAFARQKK